MAVNQHIWPWDSQPQEVVSLNPDFPAIAGFIGTSNGVQILSSGPADKYALPSNTGIDSAVGPSGYGVGQAAGASTDTVKLHSVANQTDTVWERPSVAVSVAILVRRAGNPVGGVPIFGNTAPSNSPYNAWSLTDQASGILQFACSPGRTYIAVGGGAIPNNEDVVLIGTYDGVTMRVYVRGVQTGSSAITGSLVYPSSSQRGPAVGNFYEFGGSRSFNGRVYGGILHDGAWTPEQVARISSPAGFWGFAQSRTIPIPVSAGGGGTTFTFTVSGGVAFSGASAIARGRAFPVSGGITFAGTSANVYSKVFTPSGGITFSGTTNIQHTKVSDISGGVTFGGTAPITFANGAFSNYVLTVSGGITFSGTANYAHTKTILPTGGITFSGDNVFTKGKVVLPSGGVTFGGTNSMIFNDAIAVVSRERTKTGAGT